MDCEGCSSIFLEIQKAVDFIADGPDQQKEDVSLSEFNSTKLTPERAMMIVAPAQTRLHSSESELKSTKPERALMINVSAPEPKRKHASSEHKAKSTELTVLEVKSIDEIATSPRKPSRSVAFDSLPRTRLFVDSAYLLECGHFPAHDMSRNQPPQDFDVLIAVSHRWDTADHPDPSGTQFKRLADLLTLDYIHLDLRCLLLRFPFLTEHNPFNSPTSKVGVFYDYTCLPQAPRTPQQSEFFRNALRFMNDIFSNDRILVFAITSSARDYFDRAWCTYEFIAGLLNGTLLNDILLPSDRRASIDFVPSESYRTRLVSNGGETTDNNMRMAANAFRNAIQGIEDQSQVMASLNVELGVYELNKIQLDKLKTTNESDRRIIFRLINEIYSRFNSGTSYFNAYSSASGRMGVTSSKLALLNEKPGKQMPTTSTSSGCVVQ